MTRPIRFVLATSIILWILCSAASAQTLTESWTQLDNILNDGRSTAERKEEALRATLKEIQGHSSDRRAAALFRHVASELRGIGKPGLADEAADQASRSDSLPLAFEACRWLGTNTDPEVSARALERMNDISERVGRLPEDDPVRKSLPEATDPAATARRWFDLATTYRSLGRCDRAAPWLERVAAWAEASKDPLLEQALTGLADCQTALGDTKAALATMERLHASAPKGQGPDLEFQEDLLRHEIPNQTSMEFARRLEALFLAAQEKGAVSEDSVKQHHAWFGNLYMGNGEYRRAAEEFDLWLPLLRKDLETHVPGVYDLLPNLEFAAEAHARLGHVARALEFLSVLFEAVGRMEEREWRQDPMQLENLQKAIALAKELRAAQDERREPDLVRVLAEGGSTDAKGAHTALPARYHEVTDEEIARVVRTREKGNEKAPPPKDHPAPPKQPRAPTPSMESSTASSPEPQPQGERSWRTTNWVAGGLLAIVLIGLGIGWLRKRSSK